MSTHFAAVMSVVGILSSALALADAETPVQKAMNSLFLFSETLDLVGAVAQWAISSAAFEAAGSALSTCCWASCHR